MIKEKIGKEAKSFTIRVTSPNPPETKNILLLVVAAALGLGAIWIYAKRR